MVYNTATIATLVPGFYYFNGTSWQTVGAASAGWNLTGNAGTVAATNFIGTTNNIDFVTRTNNTERMRVTSAGRVGIGTNLPIADLHVRNTTLGNTQVVIGEPITGLSAAIPNMLMAANGQTVAFIMGASNSQFGVMSWRADATQRLSIYTGAATASPLILQEFGGGNVGIGSITAPAERLHVIGNIRTSSLAGVGVRLVTSDVNGTLTNFANGSNGQVLSMVAGVPSWAANSNWTLTGNAGTVAATNFIGTTDNIDFVTRTNNTEKMRVTAAGNVGIGTTSPSGFGGKMVQLTGTGNIAFILDKTDAPARKWGMVTGGGGQYIIQDMTGGTNVFWIEPGASLNQLYLRAGGNVGIGTSTPVGGLHVVGANGANSWTYLQGNTGFGGAPNPSATINAGLMYGWNASNAEGESDLLWGNGAGTAPNLYLGTWNGATKTRYFTITSAGNVGIGTTTPVSKFNVVGKIYSTGGSAEVSAQDRTSGTQYTLYGTGNVMRLFRGDIGDVMYFTSSGNVGIGTAAPAGQFELTLDQARKPSTGTWTITSDERLKNIEGNYAKGLNEVLALNPITYHYKNVGEKTFSEEVLKTQAVGFSAQDVQKVFPEAVGTDADGYLNFNMHAILVAYTNATKELAAKDKAYETEVAAQKAKISELESKVTELEKLKAEMAEIKALLKK